MSHAYIQVNVILILRFIDSVPNEPHNLGAS